MDLKWTNKARADLARLYEFLAPVSKPAAARTVQALSVYSTQTGQPFHVKLDTHSTSNWTVGA